MEEPWRSVPRSVRDALDERGIRADGVRAAACCDMSKEGELRNIYLFLTADALLLGVSDRTGEMAYAGAQPFRRLRGLKKVLHHNLCHHRHN